MEALAIFSMFNLLKKWGAYLKKFLHKRSGCEWDSTHYKFYGNTIFLHDSRDCIDF